jgi:hypothetical protein
MFTEELIKVARHVERPAHPGYAWNFKIVILGDIGVAESPLPQCRESSPGIHYITLHTNYGTVTFQCWNVTSTSSCTDDLYADVWGCVIMFDEHSGNDIFALHTAIKRRLLVPTVLYSPKVDSTVTYNLHNKLPYTRRPWIYLARTLTGYHDIELV